MDDFKPPALDQLSFSTSTEQALRKDVFLGRKLAGLARELHQLRLETRDQLTDLLDFYSDRETGYKVGTANWLTASKKALENPETPAGVLLIAARNVLGPGVAAFEPDTLHIELEDREGLNIPAVNYDKLLAVITLTEVPAFYFELGTFKNTVLAFNNEISDPEVLQEPTPAQICWAMYEAEIVLHENSLWEPDPDEEIQVFVGTVLHREGMVLAPDILSFAQEYLDKLNKKNAGPKKDEVEKAWKDVDKSKLKSIQLGEMALDVQLAKLSACSVYMSEQADNYLRSLEELKKT